MKKTISVLTVLLGLATAARADEPKLETDDQKIVYTLGATLANSLAPYDLSPEELEILKAGLTDAALNRELKVDLRSIQPKIRAFSEERRKASAEKEKKESAQFLAKAAMEKGAVKTDSGLIYIELEPGKGESPKATDTVRVHYHGTLRDGTVFDSSRERGKPATFPLNRVIKCWTEGVQRMKVGGKSKLVCPSDIAYGDRGAPPKIKPGAALVFEVELLAIEEPKAAKGRGHP
jgi:FKBP-type peptidyl-prolyl cis-trans isomerase FkpA